MDVKEAINQRKSIRRYLEQDVEIELLNEVLDAGRMAPSGRNGQEWTFVLNTNKEIRTKLREACYNQKCVLEAPAFIVVCSKIDNIMPNNQNQGTINCSIALSFMMLRATELGLGTVWLGHFDVEKLRKVLDISEDLIPVAATPIGYAADNGRERVRKSLQEVVIRR